MVFPFGPGGSPLQRVRVFSPRLQPGETGETGAGPPYRIRDVQCPSAWSRSHSRSSMSSSPIERRIISGSTPRGALLLVAQLLVGRAGRVDDQRLGVADVGQVREQLQPLDEAPAGLEAAPDAEGEDRAGAFGQVALGQCAVGAVRQRRVVDPGDSRVRVQECGHRPRVGDVALHAQPERLQPLQEQERVERAERRAEIAQPFDARLHDVGEVAEGLVEADAVVALARLQQLRERRRCPRGSARCRRSRRRCWCRGRR